jgi:DnaJ like chaperone protein
MGLLGALVGGGLGFMLGGPLGAMLGGVIGAKMGDPTPEQLGRTAPRHSIYGRCPNCHTTLSFNPGDALVCPGCGVRLAAGPGAGMGADRGGGAAGGYASAHDTAQANAQSAFMVALISLAAKVAKADGSVTREEIATFDSFLRDQLGMTISDRRIAAQIFNRARDSHVAAGEFARQLRAVMAGQPDRLRDLVSLLLKIAWADGRLDPAEEALIRSIASDLGLGKREYDEAAALFSRNNLPGAYALLGVDPSASVEEIKKSYRRLAREYHPDTLAAKGLPEDFTRFANEKLQAINEAYQRIRDSRGF